MSRHFHTPTNVKYVRSIAILLGLAMLAGCKVHPTSDENQVAAQTVKVASEFNPATAEQLRALTGKIPYQVHGKLKRTEHEAAKEKNGQDKGYVLAQVTEAAAPVAIDCYFALDQQEAVCSLKVDQEVTIRGQLHAVSNDSVTLIGCYIVEDGQK